MPIRGDMDSYGNLLATINIKYKKFTDVELTKIKKIFQAVKTKSDDELWSLKLSNYNNYIYGMRFIRTLMLYFPDFLFFYSLEAFVFRKV